MDGICAVLLQNLISCNLRCFVAKPDLAQFTHIPCGEKLSPTFCPWRKDDKYHMGQFVQDGENEQNVAFFFERIEALL